MTIACCVPMLVVAVALAAAGVVSAGFLVAAIGCTVMMATMGHGSDHRAWQRRTLKHLCGRTPRAGTFVPGRLPRKPLPPGGIVEEYGPGGDVKGGWPWLPPTSW
jgi:hypothetical protein